MFQVLEFCRRICAVSWSVTDTGQYRAAAWVFALKALLGSERLFCYLFLFPCMSDLSSVPVVQCSSGANNINCSASFESCWRPWSYICIRDTWHYSMSLTEAHPISYAGIECMESPTSKQGLSEGTQFVWKLRWAWGGNCVSLCAVKRLPQPPSWASGWCW